MYDYTKYYYVAIFSTLAITISMVKFTVGREIVAQYIILFPQDVENYNCNILGGFIFMTMINL